jgi:hypothetical protein
MRYICQWRWGCTWDRVWKSLRWPTPTAHKAVKGRVEDRGLTLAKVLHGGLEIQRGLHIAVSSSAYRQLLHQQGPPTGMKPVSPTQNEQAIQTAWGCSVPAGKTKSHHQIALWDIAVELKCLQKPSLCLRSSAAEQDMQQRGIDKWLPRPLPGSCPCGLLLGHTVNHRLQWSASMVEDEQAIPPTLGDLKTWKTLIGRRRKDDH